MFGLGKQPEQAEPKRYEAMVETLNPRGMEFTLHGYTFPPGEWVEIVAAMAPAFRLLPEFQVREKEAGDA